MKKVIDISTDTQLTRDQTNSLISNRAAAGDVVVTLPQDAAVGDEFEFYAVSGCLLTVKSFGAAVSTHTIANTDTNTIDNDNLQGTFARLVFIAPTVWAWDSAKWLGA